MVILGGFVTSTLLNVFIVPSLYLRFGRHSQQPPTSEGARAALIHLIVPFAGKPGYADELIILSDARAHLVLL